MPDYNQRCCLLDRQDAGTRSGSRGAIKHTSLDTEILSPVVLGVLSGSMLSRDPATGFETAGVLLEIG